MKKLLNILLCFILSLNFGYSQGIKRSVISSYGASTSTNNLILGTTFGQPSNIGTITNGSYFIRQGFQQPLYNILMIPGCIDSLANNYNSYATVDDSTCLYSPFIFGCTDSTALNYNPLATVDDSSCCSNTSALWNQIGQDIDGEAIDDRSGYSVSISDNGNIVAIGSPNGGTDKGQVRIYNHNGSNWTRIDQGLYGDSNNDKFGNAVAISGDGNTVVVGAYGYSGSHGINTGKVRVFEYLNNSWIQIGSDLVGINQSDLFGSSVSISFDGNTIAIGISGDNTGIGTNAGRAIVYQNINGVWNQVGQHIDAEAAGDESGYFVSLSGDGSIVAIGAPYNDGNGQDAGHVRVYEYNGSTWNQLGSDIDGESAGDHSGNSVSLSNNGNILAIGARHNSGSGSQSGHVRIYEFSNGSWVQLGADIDGEAAADKSGVSVSLSNNGNTIAIGAQDNDGNGSASGHTRIYNWNGSNWIKLGNDIDGEASNDHSGNAVCISANGNILAIGALGNDGNGSASGHVRVYGMSNTCLGLGCLDPLALNFDPNATVDDSTCVYPMLGCIDTLAINYNVSANIDDGSCTYCTLSMNLSDTINGCDSVLLSLSIPSVANYCWANNIPQWNNVGNPSFNSGNDQFVSIEIDNNNNPYITFTQASSSNWGSAFCRKYSNNTWNTVGGIINSNATYTELAIDNNNIPYVIYHTQGYDLWASKYSGGWQNVGGQVAIGNGSYPDNPSISINNNNIPFVSYRSYQQGRIIKHLNGSSWSNTGNLSISYPRPNPVVFDINDNPYMIKFQYPTLYKYSNGWQQIGQNNFANLSSSGFPAYPDLIFDKNNTAYVAFRDNIFSNKLTVMKYDSISAAWVSLGQRGFSNGEVKDVSIVLDSHNQPYVAYQDVSNGEKLTVEYYNGTNWSVIGSGISIGKAQWIDLEIDNNDIPYVGFVDWGNNYQATVLKFSTVCHNTNNTFWVSNSGWNYVTITDSTGCIFNDSVYVDIDSVCCVSDTSFVNIDACDSIVWNGNTYDSTGTYFYNGGGSNNHSMSFDGTGGHVEIFDSSSVLDNMSHMTIMLDFQIASYPTVNTHSTLISNMETNQPYNIYLDGNSGNLIFTINNSSDSVTYPYSNLNLNQWYKLFAIYENSDSIYLYIDSVLASKDYVAPGTLNDGGRVLIGKKLSENMFFNGKIDEVSIWDIAFDYNDISSYFNCHQLIGNENNLLGYWSLDSAILPLNLNTQGITYDLSANSNDGILYYNVVLESDVACNLTNINGCDSTAVLNLTINQADTSYTNITACDSFTWNGTTYTQSGTYYYIGDTTSNNHSLDFNNVGDYISINNPININGSYSIEAMLNFPLPVTICNGIGYSHNVIASGDEQQVPAAAKHFLSIKGDSQTGSKILAIYDPFNPSTSLNTNGWHESGYDVSSLVGWHSVAVISDGSISTFFIDGDSVGTVNYSISGDLEYLGNYTPSYHLGCEWVGEVAEIKLWDYAINPSQINCCNCQMDSLLSYWDFNEGNGFTVYDQINNYNGTISGSVDWNSISNFCSLTNANGCDSIAVLNLTLGTYGCTDSVAINYDPLASCDDSSCIANVPGCTDSTACNYDLSATIDDSSCFYNYTTNIYDTACSNYTWTQNGINYTSSGVYYDTVSNIINNTHSASLSSINDFIEFPNDTIWDFGNNDFSIVFWFKPRSSSRQSIFSGETDYWLGLDFHYNNINLWASSTGQYWNLIDADNPSSISAAQNNGLGSISLTLNQWHHVALVRSGSNFSTYIDGVKDIDVNINPSDAIISRNESKRIGQWKDGGNTYSLNANIDQFSVFHSAISEQDILNYRSCSPNGNEQDIVGSWGFNHGFGSIAYDQVQNNNADFIGGTFFDLNNTPPENCPNICDSVVALNLTINIPDTSYTVVTACDSFTWNGATYTQSGYYYSNNTIPTNLNGFTFLQTYNGSHYYLSNIGTSWTNADSICNHHGGHLVTISDSIENALVDAFSTQDNLWIGLFQDISSSSYNEPSGGWKWVNGEQLNYQNWANSEPNNNTNNPESSENYAEMSSANSLWNDQWSNQSFKFILELPQNLTNANGCDSTVMLNLTIGVSGCTDSLAINYDPLATCEDSSCIANVPGCTDSLANNYNPHATIDDGSCTYCTLSVNLPDTITGCDSVQVCVDSITNSSYIWSTSNLSSSSSLAIGNTYQGGLIFYLDSLGGGLIAAPSDQSTGAEWGCHGTSISTGTAIGSGDLNTINIELLCTTTGTASDICENLNLGGYNDWFLPSKDELNEMYYSIFDGVLGNIGNLSGSYWSSSEIDANFAWDVYLQSGYASGGTQKFNSRNVRAIRAFLSPIIDTTNCIWVSNTGWNYVTVTDSLGCTVTDSVYVNVGTCGCTDALAFNYNPLATIDDSSCIYNILGCTDSLAFNYDSTATLDDGSCAFCDITMTTLLSPNSVPGNIMVSATSSYGTPTYLWSNGDTLNYNFGLPIGIYTVTATDTAGCDTTAIYTVGTIIYGCTDSTALNYNPQAIIDDGSCIYNILGCTNSLAFNYDSTATLDDGSCTFCDITMTTLLSTNSVPGNIMVSATSSYGTPTYLWSNGHTLNYNFGLPTGIYTVTATDTAGCDTTATYIVGNIIYGCTDPLYVNYNPQAVIDDGSCCNHITGLSDTIYKCDSLLTISANSGFTYLWSTGQTSQSIVVNSGGHYWLEVSDTSCTIRDSFYVHEYYTSFSSGCYTMGFEANEDISGWAIEDANNDGFSWNHSSILGVNGGSAMFYDYNTNLTTSANDWLFSQCFTLDASTTYHLSYFYKVASPNHPENMSVYIGSTQNSSSMTTLLDSHIGVTNTIFDSTSLCFTVPVSGVYYIGWHAHSLDSMWRIDLDNVSLCSGLCVYGCTDPFAINYNPLATIDDSSCISLVFGCTDPAACNYNPLANLDDGSCLTVYGCTDSTALNYNPLAQCDDGSCIATVYGCTDSLALNYYPGANVLDPSNPCCYISGCIDSTACNYDPTACYDDASCTYAPGCTDPTACNYDPSACYDDGTCEWTSCATSCGPITGVHLTDVIHDRATFNWDNMNSATCDVDQIRFRYREVGTNSWTNKTMGAPVGSGCNTTNTSKLVLNLTPSTQYEYQFKIWYCNAATVNWHANGTFTTADPCLNATNVIATPNNTTKTTFSWTAPAAPWEFVRLKYRVDAPGTSFSNIGGFGVLSPLLTKAKNGLTPGTDYRVMWRTWCNANGGPYRSPQWDGPVLWTQPSSIRLEARESISNLDVYPNPSRDIFNISFTSETIQDLQVRVLNVVGDDIIIKNLQQFVGEHVRQIDLNSYSKGIYLLEIETNQGVINKKLILQ